MGLAEAYGHPDEEFAVDLDDALVLVDCLEELKDDLDLRKQEMLVFDIAGADQSTEQVEVDRFLTGFVSRRSDFDIVELQSKRASWYRQTAASNQKALKPDKIHDH